MKSDPPVVEDRDYPGKGERNQLVDKVRVSKLDLCNETREPKIKRLTNDRANNGDL